jgi:hypothetical protein
MLAIKRDSIGRHVFGTAVVASGIVTLVWHTGAAYLYAVPAAQIIGGVAIQIRPAAKAGAALIAAAYFFLALLSIPQIIASPRVYYTWGNFFYPFANVVGAAAAYALAAATPLTKTQLRILGVAFALCNVSFAIEQVEFLARTASLVPTWIPPNQMFWAIATLVPFMLVAIALVIDRMTILATRLFARCFGPSACSFGCRSRFRIPTATRIGVRVLKPSRSAQRRGYSQSYKRENPSYSIAKLV